MSRLADEVVAYLVDHEPGMRALLEKLVRCESPSTVPETQGPNLETMGEALSDAGWSPELVAGSRDHLLAKPARRGEGRGQLLLGHCDTVWPLGTLKKMPFSVGNNHIRGPGVYDMKAGLVQLVFALKALAALRVDVPNEPIVFVNSDEEIGSPSSTPRIARLAAEVERTFVLEPSMGRSGRLKTRRKGGGSFTVVVKGRAAHAGLGPEGGASAVLELSHVIQRLFGLNDPERGITVNVGVVDAGIRPNVIAPEGRALVDVRAVESEDAARVEQEILGLEPTTPGAGIEVEGRIGRPPMEATARNRALWKLARRAGRELGLELRDGLAGGMSDGNTTSLYTATLDGLGAVGEGAHAVHELVYGDRLVERAALLALLVASPMAGAGEHGPL
jgi:glutamate carboxypeptidase